MCVSNQGMNCECVHIVVQICCYNKCGIVLKGFNPHLPKLITPHDHGFSLSLWYQNFGNILQK
jgi:hypothetical protein